MTGACSRKQGSGYRGYAAVATAGQNSLSIVDLAQFRLLRQVPLDAPSTAVLAGGPDRNLFVLTPASGSVHLLDDQLNHAGSRRYAADLAGFGLAHDGRSLFVISSSERRLFHVDARSLQTRQRWRLRAAPTSLDVSSTGLVAVAEGSTGVVELIDAKSGAQTTSQLKGAVGAIRFRTDGKLLIAANTTDRNVTLLAVPSLQVVAELPMPMTPENLCFNSNGGQVFISGRDMDGVAILFPYDTFEVDQTVLAGRSPGAMTCSDQPAYLFVASAPGSDVCILDIDRRKVIGMVEVGQEPGFLAVTPDNQYALVLNRNSGDMAVIHVSSIAAKLRVAETMRSKLAASLFTMFPVGSQPVDAVIVPA